MSLDMDGIRATTIRAMWFPVTRCKMTFDSSIIRKVREAVAQGQWHLLYVMVPADDGGQTFEMKCEVCKEFGNILARTFDHDPACPVAIEEKEMLRRKQ